MAILRKPVATNYTGAAKVSASAFTTLMGSAGADFSAESKNFTKALEIGGDFSTSFESAFQSIQNILGYNGMDDDADAQANFPGKAAAATLLAAAGDPSSYLNLLSRESLSFAKVGMEGLDSDNTVFAGTMPSHGSEYKNLYSTESFDNQVTNDYMGVSIGLAYTTGEQSPGMEAIYRTVALTPEQGGADITVPILYVANQMRHDTDGKPADFGLKRVLDAHIDPSILDNGATRLIPTRNANTASFFAPLAAVPEWVETDGRRSVTTSALITGKPINLLSLGHIDVASKVGTPNYTDALDRNVGIREVFFTLGADTFKFKISGNPRSRFVKGPEGGLKRLILDLPLTGVELTANSVTVTGDAPTNAVFDTLETTGYRVRLISNVKGHLDLEKGNIEVAGTSVGVHSILDADGNQIPLEDTTAAAIVTALADMKMEFWTPDARVTNSNFRHLGLMLNVRGVTERLQTRVRAPIFIPHPVGEDRDQKLLDYLTWAVQTQKEADGIATLIEWHERTMELTGGLRGELTPGDFEENVIQIEGIGRYLINPYIQTVDVDLTDSQALETQTALANGQEKLIMTIRSLWFDILQRTGYDAAARYTDGGKIVRKYGMTAMTTEYVKRLMTVVGDTRTLGADVPYKMFSSVNKNMFDANNDISSMYLVMSREGDDIDPLNAGVLLQSASLVSALKTTRDGAHNAELVVQPRYAYANLCPIVVKINVKGAKALMEQTIPFKVNNTVIGGEEVGGGEEEPPVTP